MTDSWTRRDFLVQTAGALSIAALAPDPSALARPDLPPGGLPIALVGCGRQGRAIIAELQKIEGAKIAAVCDTDDARMTSGARRAPGADPYPDHRALLDKAKDVKAVIIATPTHHHAQIVADTLQSGRHVYCEAPLAHSIDDCRAIAQAVKASSKLIFHAGLEARSNPVYKLARSFYRSDAVREQISAEAQRNEKTSWRFPSSDPSRDKAVNWRLDPDVSLGLAGEWGASQLDAIMWFTDSAPDSVSGAGAIRLYNDSRSTPDTIDCALAFPKGLRARFSATLASSVGGRFELLRGANASIKLAWSHGWMFKEADAPTQGWEVYANRQQFHNEEGITLIADATKLASQGKLKDGVGLPNTPLYYALSDFLSSVANSKHPACSAADGLRATLVAIHMAKAVRDASTVSIDPALLRMGDA